MLPSKTSQKIVQVHAQVTVHCIVHVHASTLILNQLTKSMYKVQIQVHGTSFSYISIHVHF